MVFRDSFGGWGSCRRKRAGEDLEPEIFLVLHSVPVAIDGNVAPGLQILMQQEASPKHAAVAQHKDDMLHPRLVNEGGAGVSEVDLG